MKREGWVLGNSLLPGPGSQASPREPLTALWCCCYKGQGYRKGRVEEPESHGEARLPPQGLGRRRTGTKCMKILEEIRVKEDRVGSNCP